MNSNKFLGGLFCLAICYQLLCTSFTAIDNDTNNMKTEYMFNETEMFNISEQTQNIEHLNKPKRYKLSKKGKDGFEPETRFLSHFRSTHRTEIQWHLLRDFRFGMAFWTVPVHFELHLWYRWRGRKRPRPSIKNKQSWKDERGS